MLAFTHQLCQAAKKSKIGTNGCFIVSFIQTVFLKAACVSTHSAIMTVSYNIKGLGKYQSLLLFFKKDIYFLEVSVVVGAVPGAGNAGAAAGAVAGAALSDLLICS